MANGEPFCTAGWIMDAVEAWASDQLGEYWLWRESVAAVEGRIDGLLIPASYQASIFKKRSGHWLDKAAVVGVEAKANRADFLRGLREGQFDRYTNTSSALGGLYLATTRAVKTSEVPPGIGHLVVYDPPGEPKFYNDGSRRDTSTGWRCVCRRSPQYRDTTMDPELMWRIVFYAIGKMRAARIEAREELRRVKERIGTVAERKIMAVLDRAEQS